ncbi:hypothetical protein BCR37DRAFT_383503 [Protomyces lactucae-debilis]|uniref:Uncharacterized protein n=1 Tax=Protomyces lactucae-debilis TaxID=2754530 RepID=A0A1Y2EXP4_PROLT|nr:uncharacterized protein BCR37DRAFT_383503 [Protomyces lactucae-debilis]ORY76369.1 hypothetical protein BCR37DRAFT_383503 [Protomyces lactucae-debilis]
MQGALHACYAPALVPPRWQRRRGHSCHSLQPGETELSPSSAGCVFPVVVSMNQDQRKNECTVRRGCGASTSLSSSCPWRDAMFRVVRGPWSLMCLHVVVVVDLLLLSLCLSRTLVVPQLLLSVGNVA